MDIIKSDIVSSEHDAYWGAIGGPAGKMTPRPLLVLVSHSEGDTVATTQLQKMLDASGLSAEQYNIVSVADGEQIAWHQLRHHFKPGVVFLLGVLPAQLGVSALFRLNEPNRFNDTIWLPTLSIALLAEHADAKKQLWLAGMKPIFVDKVYGDIVAVMA
jgi:CheY-like chemotaxis protein